VNPRQNLAPIPVWEAHWSTERLREEEQSNPRSFRRGFRQESFSDDERMFPSFETCFTPGIVVG
jgi:hypothetical protein